MFPDQARGERRTAERLSGAQVLWKTLESEGVQVVFGYPGGAIMPAYDALPEFAITHVLTRHEQGAAHMADGYARASGKLGVVVATSGPGATNLVTGIATAMADSVPVLCITGQVASHLLGTDAFQETDITGVALPVTKQTYLVTEADDIASVLREAIHVATSGRPGPVLVDITKDAQMAQTTCMPTTEAVSLPGFRPRGVATVADFERAADLLNASERPLVLCGHGVICSGATEALTELVERQDIPVALTLLGLGGFPASHPRHLGMMGMHGDAWVNRAIQQADLLIAVGMRFDDRVTGDLQTYARHSKKIHIELDPAEINKLVQVDIPLVGDAKECLTQLSARVSTRARGEWLETIEHAKKDADARDIKLLPDNGNLHAAHVIHDLWRLTEGKAVVVTDVGQHQMWEAQYFPHEKPRSLLTSGGLGTMGFALPAAIGARLARPDEEVWVICGDGGFQMTACELSTCAQEGINLNIAIINNGYLGMVRQWQEFFFERRYVCTPISSPDFVKLAEAHGLVGLRVERRADIAAAVAEAKAINGTVVIDFRVEQEDTVYPMVPNGNPLDDMIRRPHPAAEVSQ
jgi:acetolactate synthase I/II/III large subunit